MPTLAYVALITLIIFVRLRILRFLYPQLISDSRITVSRFKQIRASTNTRGLLVALLLAVSSSAAYASTPRDTQPRGLQNWLSNYYLTHDGAALPQYLTQMRDDGLLSQRQNQAALSVFLAQVFKENRSTVRHLLRRFNSDHQATRTIVYALWLAGMTAEARAMARRNGWTATATEELSLNAPDLNQLQRLNPALVDVFWAAYYGSGKNKYLETILHSSYQDSSEQQPATATQLAARWSLSKNVLQHQRVREFLENQIIQDPDHKPQIQALLERGLKDIQSFAVHSGNFSAGMHLHSEKNYDAIWNHTPPLRLPINHTKLELQPEQVLNIEVFATGMHLDKQQFGKVSYQLKITDAKQQTLVFATNRNIVHALIATPFEIRRGAPYQYRPGTPDKPEKLTITVTVTDHNTAQQLELTGQVTLLAKPAAASVDSNIISTNH